jgi:hypothetical protein
LKVSVDNQRCHRYGFCQAEAPDVFQLREDGRLAYRRTPEPAWRPPALARWRNICSANPVLAVPSGWASNDVPTGVQVIVAKYEDVTAFRVAHAIERVVAAGFVGTRLPELWSSCCPLGIEALVPCGGRRNMTESPEAQLAVVARFRAVRSAALCRFGHGSVCAAAVLQLAGAGVAVVVGAAGTYRSPDAEASEP